MVRRVLVKGGSGAGKTTLGRALAGHLNVPCIELDALHHGPNWTAASAEELRARVLQLADDERGWVVDGNYDSKLGALLLDRAELVVWLDLPLTTKLWRLIKRSSSRWVSQEELWNGNRETLGGLFWGADSLFLWAIRSHYRQRRAWPQQFAGRRCVRLRTTEEVERWLAAFHAQAKHAP